MRSLFRSLIILSLPALVLFLSSCEREESPVLPKNHSPQINGLAAESNRVLVNTEIRLTCSAEDKDGDLLTINWSSTRGTFNRGKIGDTVFWKSPSTEGRDTIIVSISDGKLTIQSKIEIYVGTLPSKPMNTKPGDNSTEIGLSPTLSWRAAKGATGYTLQVSDDSLFKNFVINKNIVKGRSGKMSGLNSGRIYFWRVRSKNSFGHSRWSDYFSFKTVAPPEPPIQVSPGNLEKEISLTPFFTWRKLTNAQSYSIEISHDNSFSVLIYYKKGITDTTLQVGVLNPLNSYFWRVNATNEYGTSDWSSVWNCSIRGIAPTSPGLLSPVNNLMNVHLSTILSWNESSNASGYGLQVSTDSLFADYFINKSEVSITSIEIGGLASWRKYYWRVYAYNKYGISGWSEINTFKTELSEPSLTSPLDGAAGVSMRPVLNWNEVPGATGYTLQVATDSSFLSLIYDEIELNTTNRELAGLESFTKYYWRVKSENPFDISKWSDVRSFTVSGYFYKALPYGNQAVYNPAYVLLNGGFDMIQVGNQRAIKNFPYDIAFTNIWRNLSDPFTPIKNYGWWNFISDQVLPLSLTKDNAQFWPNYSLHVVGGGMEYAALKEWYEYNKYPYPQWFSALTIMSYHLINEVVENNNRIGDDVDPIADIYLFDIGGILLFTSDNVKRFFAEDLNLADWSQQPSFSLRDGTLHNNGQFFSVKWKLPFSESLHAFYYFGTNGVGGLSYKYKDGSALSVGLGLAASDLVLLDEKTNKKTLGLVGNIGVFYDKNNSLLASVSVTIKTDYMVNVNIYPGVVKLWGMSPGLWGAYSQDGNIILGFTATWFPFGFGFSTK